VLSGRFRARCQTVVPGTELYLEPGGGRSSSEVLPFFNLDQGQPRSRVGIGWTANGPSQSERMSAAK